MALLLASGCGAPPPARPPRPLVLGALPHAGLTAYATPQRIERALARLDDRLGESLDALGPLGTAWQRARQGLDDTLAALEGPPGAGRAAAWGIDGAAPVALWWAAGDPAGLAKAFLGRLAGASAPDAQGVVWHARLAVQVVDPVALQAALQRVVDRLGWASTAAPLVLRGVRWQVHGPDGLWLGLRTQDGVAAVDLVRTVGADPRDVLAAALERGARWQAPSDRAGLILVAAPAGLGALEAALAADVGLRQAEQARREAVAEVMTTCVDAWSRLAGLAPATTHRVEVDPQGLRWRVDVQLAPPGVAAWAGAQRPLPLAAGGPEPAGYQVALVAAGFPDPGLPVLARCPATPDWLRALAAPPAAPALLALAAPPQPAPPVGWGAGTPTAFAALVLGAGEGGVPHLGAVQVGVKLPEAPLGPRATVVADPEGPRWVLGVGGLAVSAAQRAVAGRPVALFGIGPDAALGVARRLAEGGGSGGAFAEAWLRPGALADTLVGAGLGGPEVQALRAVAARLGPLRLEGRRAGDTLTFEARWGELDHPPGGQ